MNPPARGGVILARAEASVLRNRTAVPRSEAWITDSVLDDTLSTSQKHVLACAP